MLDVDRLVDPATGLSSEWHFEIILDFVFPIAHRGVTLTLVLFRIDEGEWAVNHQKPDQVITDFGSTLRGVTRSSDVIGRFGEDMFLFACFPCVTSREDWFSRIVCGMRSKTSPSARGRP